jgi:putative methionine-R-sulfoxide reductase with GAF domain
MFELKISQVGNDVKSDGEPGMVLTKETNNSGNEGSLVFIKKSASQGKNLLQFSKKVLSFLAREKEISQGIFYIAEKKKGKPVLKYLSGYAHQNPEAENEVIEFGEGFPGQVAKDGKPVIINDIPEGYMSIESGLGKGSPASLIIVPVKSDDNVLAVIEMASFHKFTSEDMQFFDQITPAIAEQILLIVNKS